jgi:hypothetical protein
VLSTGEQIAVALVLNRVHLLEGFTILEAVERLGPHRKLCPFGFTSAPAWVL